VLCRKESKAGMNYEFIRLLNRIEKKIYNDEQSRKTAEKQTSVARLGEKQLTIFVRCY